MNKPRTFVRTLTSDERHVLEHARASAELLDVRPFPDVPGTNNRAERVVRPEVRMRKASHGSASLRGAATWAVLMTVFRTRKKRGLEPLAETRWALRTLAETGTVPPAPGRNFF